jgi:hypothetical protein
MQRKVPYVYVLAMATASSWMGGVYSMSFGNAEHVRWFSFAASIPVLGLLALNLVEDSRPALFSARLARLACAAYLLQLAACIALLVLGYAHLTDGTVTWLKRAGAVLGLAACVGLLKHLQSGSAKEPTAGGPAGRSV